MTQNQPPMSKRLLAFAMRILNVPMRLILSLHRSTPLGKRLMLVYLTGRKSGKQYKQPISYVEDGDTLLTPGGGKWKLNLVDGRPERRAPSPRTRPRPRRGRTTARRHEFGRTR